MGDTGYQPYCEKCGAPVVWCTCLDDVDWSLEMRSHLGRVRLEQQVKELRAELARRDEELSLTEKKLCNIDRSARAEVARRDEIIARLKEDAERLATRAVYWDEYGNEYECIHLECGAHSENILLEHSSSCPITLHRALMKELGDE